MTTFTIGDAPSRERTSGRRDAHRGKDDCSERECEDERAGAVRELSSVDQAAEYDEDDGLHGEDDERRDEDGGEIRRKG